MLAAVLGHLAPSLWKDMADSALAANGRVGHLEDYASLVEFLKASSSQEVAAHLAKAQETLALASEKQKAQQFAEVVQLAGAVHEQLVQAYALAQPSKPVEGRACWNHSGTGAYEGDWDRTAKELAENGFNMVLPNMLWGGVAHYPSDVLPRSQTFEKHGDQIAQCVAAAKKYGLQVHVWKVNWNLSTAPGSSSTRSGASSATRFPSRVKRKTGCALPIRRIFGWNWKACWRWPASTRSMGYTSTTSAIRIKISVTAMDAGRGSSSRPEPRYPSGPPTATRVTCGTSMCSGDVIKSRDS